MAPYLVGAIICGVIALGLSVVMFGTDYFQDNNTPRIIHDEDIPKVKTIPVNWTSGITVKKIEPPPQQQIIQPIVPTQPSVKSSPNIIQIVTQKIRIETSDPTKKPVESDMQIVTYGDFELRTADLEGTIHNFINLERAKQGLAKLEIDPYLTGIARNHSKDMATRNFFAHDNPDGQDPTARANALGYTCHKELGGGYYSEGIAENIFQNNLYDSIMYVDDIPSSYAWNTQEEIAKTTVDGWMNSEGHRQNILTESYDLEGLGVYVSSDDKVYITQDFC